MQKLQNYRYQESSSKDVGGYREHFSYHWRTELFEDFYEGYQSTIDLLAEESAVLKKSFFGRNQNNSIPLSLEDHYYTLILTEKNIYYVSFKCVFKEDYEYPEPELSPILIERKSIKDIDNITYSESQSRLNVKVSIPSIGLDELNLNKEEFKELLKLWQTS